MGQKRGVASQPPLNSHHVATGVETTSRFVRPEFPERL